MNTTEAATTADVTIATIRAWCRKGVVAAVKLAGRWVINAASLARRIAIGAIRARKATVTAPNYASFAAEARDLVARLTPAKGCHPADRIGGARDRASGRRRARNLAQYAATAADRADAAAAEGRTHDAADQYSRATETLAAARTAAANIKSL